MLPWSQFGGFGCNVVSAKKVQTNKVQTKKVQTKKAQTNKVQTKKAQTNKVQTKKAQTKKVQTKKAQTNKLQTNKVQIKKAKTKKAKTKVAQEAPKQRADCLQWSFGEPKGALDSSKEIDVKELERKAALLHGAPPEEQNVAGPSGTLGGSNDGAKEARRSSHRRYIPGQTSSQSGLAVEVDKVDQRSSECSGTPGGEKVSLERWHRLRAFAQSKEGDLSIGVGPDVVVREKGLIGRPENEEKSKVSPGVGFQLNLDF